MRFLSLGAWLVIAAPALAADCIEEFAMLPTPLNGWEIADRGEYTFNPEDGGAAL